VPTYQYVCTDCAEPLEAVQSFTDDALTVCPACGGTLRKVFGSVGVVFKGSGFYRTDSRASSSASDTAASKGTSSDSKSNASGGSSTGSSGDSSSGSGSSGSGSSGSGSSGSGSSGSTGSGTTPAAKPAGTSGSAA
jgi:putative FmdB family regulatory protein